MDPDDVGEQHCCQQPIGIGSRSRACQKLFDLVHKFVARLRKCQVVRSLQLPVPGVRDVLNQEPAQLGMNELILLPGEHKCRHLDEG